MLGGAAEGWVSAVWSKTARETVELSCPGATELFICIFFWCFVEESVIFLVTEKEHLWNWSVSNTAMDTFHAFFNFLLLWLHELLKWSCCSSCYLLKAWAGVRPFCWESTFWSWFLSWWGTCGCEQMCDGPVPAALGLYRSVTAGREESLEDLV